MPEKVLGVAEEHSVVDGRDRSLGAIRLGEIVRDMQQIMGRPRLHERNGCLEPVEARTDRPGQIRNPKMLETGVNPAPEGLGQEPDLDFGIVQSVKRQRQFQRGASDPGQMRGAGAKDHEIGVD